MFPKTKASKRNFVTKNSSLNVEDILFSELFKNHFIGHIYETSLKTLVTWDVLLHIFMRMHIYFSILRYLITLK